MSTSCGSVARIYKSFCFLLKLFLRFVSPKHVAQNYLQSDVQVQFLLCNAILIKNNILLRYFPQSYINPIFSHCIFAAPVTMIPARITHSPPEDVEVLAGDTLTLECVIEGSPVPRVIWDKYGGELPEGRYVQQLGMNFLCVFFLICLTR